jgi:hypothetical protein
MAAETFSDSREVEEFLKDHGIVCEKLYYFQPLTKKPVPYWKVFLGKSPCEVYNIVEWANLVYS